MGFKCWLGSLGNSSTASGSNDPGGDGRSGLRAIVALLELRFFVPISLLFCLRSYCVSLSYLNFTAPMQGLGGHSLHKFLYSHTEWNLLFSLSCDHFSVG